MQDQRQEQQQEQEYQRDQPQKKSKAIFSALASIPSVVSARFLIKPTSEEQAAQKDNLTTLHIDYSISDHSRFTKLRATQSIHLIQRHQADPLIISSAFQFIDPEIVHQSFSPTGSKLAIFRAINDAQSHPNSTSHRTQPKFLIDIWDNSINALESSYDLTSAHQAFILNSTFGYPSWNTSETCLAYVAESIQPSHSSWLERNRYRPNFGEQLTEIRSPAIFVLSIDQLPTSIQKPDISQPARIVQLTADTSDSNHALNLAFAQPVFGHRSGRQASDHHQIFCTGFASLSDHRRLGLIYCQNRPSAIYEIKFKIPLIHGKQLEDEPIKASHPIQQSFTRISDPNRSAQSPYVIDDKNVVYISNTIGGPHASCASFHLYNPHSNNHSILVGPVNEPPAPSPEELDPFPGLYLDQIPSRAHLIDPSDPDKIVILISSISGSNNKPVTIELDSGRPTLHPSPDDCSCTLLATDGHLNALFTLSKTNHPPQIWCATLFRKKGLHFSWRLITELKPSTEFQSQLSKLESRVIKLPKNEMGPTEIVLTTPKRDILDHLALSKSSLIIVPHGGPHSTSLNEFSPSTASMALLGYSTAYVNYPGSLGFGQKWVTELPKHLSINDVESCKLALEYLLSLDFIVKLNVDDRVFISGGSHGGFITAHLTSRYPALFRAACLRNPVVDLVATAGGGSDIPDWSYAEVNLKFPILSTSASEQVSEPQQLDGKVSVNEVDFKTLRDNSPIKFIHNVKTPTLVLLGSQDRRVSNQQGLAWYHGIKNNNNHHHVRTELILFDKDSHPLSSPFAQLNSFMIWLEFLSSYSHFS